MTDPIIIVGSGLAGYVLAKEFRRLNTKAPLIVVTAAGGEFYSKPLLSTALTHNKTPDMLPVESVQGMREQLMAEIYANTVVERIDTASRSVYTSDGESYTYSQLVLACGAEPIALSVAGDAAQAILSVNNLEDYAVLREQLIDKQHVTIIGAGLVGCEGQGEDL